MSVLLSFSCSKESDSIVEKVQAEETLAPQEPTTSSEDNTLGGNAPGNGNNEDCNIAFDDSDAANMLPVTKSVNLTAEQEEYVNSNNDFAFNFYRCLCSSAGMKGKSNITSPLSLSIVLGMLNEGAQGQTANEISSLIGFSGWGKTAINGFFRTLMEELPMVDESVTLKIANMVAYDKKVTMEDAYVKNVTENYQAETPQLDFTIAKNTADYINHWCNKKTEGMVPEVVTEEDINENTILAFLNAIYFKATWSNKFDSKYTLNETFMGTVGQQSVSMMHRKAMIEYAQNGTYAMVNLPYGGGDKWSMKVLLPNEGKTVNDIITSLTTNTWKTACQQFMPYIVDLKLPRFKTRSAMELNSLLAEMGITTMFDKREADFSPITKNLKKNDGKALWVSLVKQVAATEVSEEGTKLAAITTATAETDGSVVNIDNKVYFHANRPFVYIVQEASSGIICFIGVFQGS